MPQKCGIIDKTKNPFGCDSWIGQGHGLTIKRANELSRILGKSIKEIEKGDRNEAKYPAFVGIRWGFAEVVDNRLVPTEKWHIRHNYNKHGEPKNFSGNKTFNSSIKTKATATIKIPNDRNQLINNLRLFNAGKVISRYRKKDLGKKTPKDILSFTFGNSIARAFRYEAPKRRFCNWSYYNNPDPLIAKLNKIKTQKKYDEFLYDIGQSLLSEWGHKNNRNEQTRMNIGIALKITNLIMKHLSFSPHVDNPDIINCLHVPWDKFTLRPLQKICTLNPPIRSNAAQGFVKNIHTYNTLHEFISGIARSAGVPRIYYEFYCWDADH